MTNHDDYTIHDDNEAAHRRFLANQEGTTMNTTMINREITREDAQLALARLLGPECPTDDDWPKTEFWTYFGKMLRQYGKQLELIVARVQNNVTATEVDRTIARYDVFGSNGRKLGTIEVDDVDQTFVARCCETDCAEILTDRRLAGATQWIEEHEHDLSEHCRRCDKRLEDGVLVVARDHGVAAEVLHHLECEDGVRATIHEGQIVLPYGWDTQELFTWFAAFVHAGSGNPENCYACYMMSEGKVDWQRCYFCWKDAHPDGNIVTAPKEEQPWRLVVREFTTVPEDPTSAYVLSCGHTVL